MATNRKFTTPGFIDPMLAQAVIELPQGPEWIYEPKLDGHRVLIVKDGHSVAIRTRRDKRPTVSVRTVAAAAAKIKAKKATVDGELTLLDENGIPSFDAIQRQVPNWKEYTVAYFAFDLPSHEGRPLITATLEERQRLLAETIADSGLLLCSGLPGKLDDVTSAVKEMGLEGIIAKRRSSRYRVGVRSFDWQKKRFYARQEFVVGGYKPEGRDSVLSIVVGVYENGKLVFSSKVQGGLNQQNRRELRRELRRLNNSRCPFFDLPNSESRREPTGWSSGGVTAEEMREIQWVRPELVAEVRFVEWTPGNKLREPLFVGLRMDKSPKEVVREIPGEM